ncbi:MAG: serine hydrolase domain-containing protein [Hyphomicrobiaceae bacterium]|nr:serine hydrolase domain-containing protein [Hyphomicrobiaceae bacterium]
MQATRRLLLASAAILAACGAAAIAKGPTSTSDARNGFSEARLANLEAYIRNDIDKGLIPGATITVVKGDKVVFQKFLGVRDAATKQPMTADTIFRIYSMTKPITTVAAMMLVEEGRLALEDPVAKHLPEFKDVKVGVEKPDASGKPSLELVAPRRPMTVHDLMRHTSGLTYGFFGEGLVKKSYVEANLGAGDPTTAEFVKRLAALPLVYQPGTTWDYSQSTDVLGRIIEVVSGQTLLQFMKERILDPLGMKDTSFYVTEKDKHDRIAEPLPNDRAIGAGAQVNDPRQVRNYESGGGGLVSTTADYQRFLQMLLNGGALDGKRYLSPKTIETMAANHIGPAAGVQPGPYYLPGPGYGFGLGFAVRTETGANGATSSVGEYYWGGAAGTAFWVDPKENLFVLYMMQSPSQRVRFRPALRNMVYGAIER